MLRYRQEGVFKSWGAQEVRIGSIQMGNYTFSILVLGHHLQVLNHTTKAFFFFLLLKAYEHLLFGWLVFGRLVCFVSVFTLSYTFMHFQ